jgi:hypothetical protein
VWFEAGLTGDSESCERQTSENGFHKSKIRPNIKDKFLPQYI